MTLGDDETKLVVILHLVGAEEDGVAADAALRADRRRRHGRRGEQRAQAQNVEAAHPRQPSSRCSSMLAPKSQLTPAGVQAASATGVVPARPRAKTRADTRQSAKAL